jgi:molybdopterin-guanine dinucleotide biosynthesis protein A
MFDVEGAILVGGQSRRMGRDKADLLLHGQTLPARIAEALSSVASRVFLVGARKERPELNLRNVPDVHEAWGALGGIHAALTEAKTDWLVVVACDLPFVTRELFERLRSFISDVVDAVVPIQADGRPQPVCAVYRRDTCLREIERLIAAGEHSPRALLANVRTCFVEFSEVNDLPHADRFFFNINTPADYAEANELEHSP